MELNINKNTVADIIEWYSEENRIKTIPQTGRPKSPDLRIVKLYEKDNSEISTPILTRELYEETGKIVMLIQFVICYMKIVIMIIARKMLFINKINRKKRLTFTKKFVFKEKMWWKDMIFANENKFEISGCNKQKIVLRKANKQFKRNPQYRVLMV